MEQVFGTVMHGALRFMFERSPLYPSPDEVVNRYRKTWKEAAEKLRPDEKESDEEREKRCREEEMYLREGEKMLLAFYKKNKPWNKNAIELESRFSVSVSDEEKEYTLSGIIDRIDKDPQRREYEIIDYKTGKKMPSAENLKDDLQLAVYTLALTEKWKHVSPENIRITLYYLRHNDAVSVMQSADRLERAKKRITAIMDEIQRRTEEGKFEPTPSALCDWCGFRPLCPMWKHEYAKEKTPSDREIKRDVEEFFRLKERGERDKKRMAALKEKFHAYMKEKEILRIFGESGYVMIKEHVRRDVDLARAEPILREAGVWDNILAPDKKKALEEIKKLPPALMKRAAEAVKETRAATLYAGKRKKAEGGEGDGAADERR